MISHKHHVPQPIPPFVHYRFVEMMPPDAPAPGMPMGPPGGENLLPGPGRPRARVLGFQTAGELHPAGPLNQVTVVDQLDAGEMLPKRYPSHKSPRRAP